MESESDCGVPDTEGPTLLLGSASDVAGDTLDALVKPGGDVNCRAGFGTDDTGDGRRVGCELDGTCRELDGPKGAGTTGFGPGCKLDGDGCLICTGVTGIDCVLADVLPSSLVGICC